MDYLIIFEFNLNLKIMKKLIFFIMLSNSLIVFSQTAGIGLTDVDGNIYNSVTIGTQEWMKENLNVSKYSDGTPIPQVTDPTQWALLTTGAWCYYDNDPTNGINYGKLYNWYAVVGKHDTNPNTPNKKLAPTDYHVPSDAEWSTLFDYLGGEIIAGGKMKETGTVNWISPNTDATNSSGFTGLPGGYRYNDDGLFNAIGRISYWWSSSEYSITEAWFSGLRFNYGYADFSGLTKPFGFSVRCLRDSSLSNATFNTSSLQLYPNPVVKVLNVNIDSNLINQPFTIIDNLGKVILKGKLNEGDNLINVEQLSKGIYYLKVSDKNASKFIKE